MLAAILKQIKSDPAQALAVLGPILTIFGPALVPLISSALPAGPLRAHLEAHPDDALAFLRAALNVVSEHPALVKAAAEQFGGEQP